MWEQGYNLLKPQTDINKKMLALPGELTDEVAMATMAEFLYHNPAFALDLMAGIKLYPMQELMLKGWMQNDFNLWVASRGLSKSFLAAVFCIFWGLFNPNNRIVLMSFAFRASRRILEQAEKFINEKEPVTGSPILMKSSFPDNIKKANDEWKLKIPNGASILSLPLGDGKKVRGIRADTLVLEELAYMPETILAEVIQPFLASKNDVKEYLKIKEEEDELIKKGIITEDQRTKLKDNIKIIGISSACFQFEHMYKRYCEWTSNVLEKKKDQDSSYFIARMSHASAPEGMMNNKIIEEARKSFSQAMFAREYEAMFTADSDGYFRAKKLTDCTIPDGQRPTTELVGEKGADYVLAIDPSFSGAEHSDHFAMSLLKIVQKGERKIGMLVNSYAIAGGDLKDHIQYFHYLLTYFNIVYIAIDASTGDSNEFINSSVQSQVFKQSRIELHDLDIDFNGDAKGIPGQIRRLYNRTAGRIVQKQQFSSGFQRSANEYLQSLVDYQGILFAGKCMATEGMVENIRDWDLPIIKNHSKFKEWSNSDFAENQDYLVGLTKSEMTMITTSTTPLGAITYDLPSTIKRSKNPDRIRKDNYSSLLLASWALKLYLESLDMKEEAQFNTFTPMIFGRR